MNTDVLFSSESEEWETPKELFDYLDELIGGFTLDPASTDDNSLCQKHFTKKEDGLKQSWEGEKVFLNPPYGREVKHWIKKSYEESRKHGTCVVCLLPARTDTQYFHDYCTKAKQITFIKGRLKFKNKFNEVSTPAPFPSMIVTFYNNNMEHLPFMDFLSLKESVKNVT